MRERMDEEEKGKKNPHEREKITKNYGLSRIQTWASAISV